MILFGMFYSFILWVYKGNSVDFIDGIYIIGLFFFDATLFILAFSPAKIKKIHVINIFFNYFNEENLVNYGIHSSVVFGLFFIFTTLLGEIQQRIA
jgi:hypothetical protein